MLEFILLGFLMKEPLTGYDLKQHITHSTAYFFDASYGSIYPALKRLEASGYIQAQKQSEGKKLKIVYSITPAGTAAFLERLHKPIPFSKTKQNHLVFIFFYEYLEPDVVASHLRTFIQEVTALCAQLQEERLEIPESCKSAPIPFRYATSEYGIQYYQLVIQWCQKLLSQVEEHLHETSNS